MFLLDSTLRPYAWGSTTAMAQLLGREPSGEPEAELWIGAHPDSPSIARTPDGRRVPLDELVAADPVHHLGPAVAGRFEGHLPYLVKILAAERPLSLQVHPNQEQAREGYAAEEAAGIPRDAAQRNYKDPNHKPEMLLALTPFEALCGFRDPEESAASFAQLSRILPEGSPESAELAAVAAVLGTDGRPPGADAGASSDSRLREAFSRLCTGEDVVRRAVAAIAGLGADRAAAEEPLRTVAELHTEHPGDPGALVALLLNRVRLAPGEAMYLPAGNVHAYLHGVGIEVMASSDNVLRGGLTAKHVDVPELLRTVAFEPLAPPVLEADRTALGQELYRPPFPEFQLQRILLEPGGPEAAAGPRVPLAQDGPAVVLAVTGDVEVVSPTQRLTLRRGQSAFVPAAEFPVELSAGPGGIPPEGTLAFGVTTRVADADGG